MDEKKKTEINFLQIVKTLLSHKMLFLKVWVITFALSCLWILPQPRYYTTKVSVAPESATEKGGGDLASLASSFGFNLGNGSSDAIYPQLYPDLFKSTEFCVGLLDIKVQTKDGEISTDYYDYLKNHQKSNLLFWPFYKLRNWVKSIFKKPEVNIPGKDGKRFDPFRLTTETAEIIEGLQSCISCTYSKTTDVVTINVTDQDPLVCALLADSVRQRLQVFITDYRTKKSRIDYEHFKQLTDEARDSYDEARRRYAAYSDAHQDAFLQSVRTKAEDLENDMQLKFNIYTAMNTRKEAAMAKVQENTPAFTTLTNATVPVKPAGPKRMIFVAAMLFLATIATTAKLFRKELKEWF